MATETSITTSGRTSDNTYQDLRSTSRASHRRHKHLERYNWYRDLWPEEFPTPSNVKNTLAVGGSYTQSPSKQRSSETRVRRTAFKTAQAYNWPNRREPRILNQAPKRQARIFGKRDNGIEIRSERWRGDIQEKEHLDRWVREMSDVDAYFAFGRFRAEFEELRDAEVGITGCNSADYEVSSIWDREERGSWGDVRDDHRSAVGDENDEGYDSAHEIDASSSTVDDELTYWLDFPYSISWHRDWAGNWISGSWPCGTWCYCDCFDVYEPEPSARKTCGLEEYVKGEFSRKIFEREQRGEEENDGVSDGNDYDQEAWEVAIRMRAEGFEMLWEGDWDVVSRSGASEAWSEVGVDGDSDGDFGRS